MFAYGSLVAAAGEEGVPAVLADHERWWGVAMDNADAVPGYKRYLDPATGTAPDVAVAFVDVRPAPGAAVHGVVVPVDEAGLDALDGRERNYERRDVSDAVDAPVGGPVVAYVGSPEGRARRAGAAEAERLVVSARYREVVRAGLARLDPAAAARFDRCAPPCPVVELQRVEL